MTKLYKYIPVMAKYGKLVQRYTHIWAIHTKICPEMAMLYKTARIGQVVQGFGHANICPDMAKHYNFLIRSG